MPLPAARKTVVSCVFGSVAYTAAPHTPMVPSSNPHGPWPGFSPEEEEERTQEEEFTPHQDTSNTNWLSQEGEGSSTAMLEPEEGEDEEVRLLDRISDSHPTSNFPSSYYRWKDGESRENPYGEQDTQELNSSHHTSEDAPSDRGSLHAAPSSSAPPSPPPEHQPHWLEKLRNSFQALRGHSEEKEGD